MRITDLFNLSTAKSFASGALKTGKFLGKAAIGGTAGRMALGAGIGAAYGIATNPYENTNMGLTHIARSALIGGALGGASRLFTPNLLAGKNMKMPLGFKFLRNDIKKFGGGNALDSLGGMAAWGLTNPIKVAGTVGAGIALTSVSSPYTSPNARSINNAAPSIQLSRERQQIENIDSSIAPMRQVSSGAAVRNQRLMQSTYGLVQGLNRGRHS